MQPGHQVDARAHIMRQWRTLATYGYVSTAVVLEARAQDNQKDSVAVGLAVTIKARRSPRAILKSRFS